MGKAFGGNLDMKMRKALLAIFASFAMIITMIPLSTVTVSAVTDNDFTLYYNSDDEQLHMGNMNGDVFNATPKTWSGSGSTLTLNGFEFNTSAHTGLICDGNTTIVLKEDNIISANPLSEGDGKRTYCYGISAPENGNLTFSGSGNLTVSANKANNEGYCDCAGILGNNGSITFEGSGIIEATGGESIITESMNSTNTVDSCGVYSQESITVTNGEVIATGGSTANPSRSGTSTGTSSQFVNVSGGKLTATAGNASGYRSASSGIYGDRDVKISGGEVTATAGEVTGNGSMSIGIVSQFDSISISNAKVTAKGGNLQSGGKSYGIDGGNSVSVSNSDVTATSGKLVEGEGYCYGIHTTVFDFNSGTVNATGLNSTESNALESVGIYSFAPGFQLTSEVSASKTNYYDRSGSININQAGLTVKGGTVALYCGEGDMSNNKGANIKDGVYAVGSKNYDGSKLETYVKANSDSYKYVATKVKEKTPVPSPSEEASDSSADTTSDSTADTGDSTNLVLPIGIAIAALLAAAGVTFGRRRYNK